jgi:NAD(P)H-dependent FMN reductase
VNFTAELVGDVTRPGIKDLITRLRAQGGRTPEEIVDGCLDLMGPLEMNPKSRQGLIGFVEDGGDFSWDTDEHVQASTARVSELLQLIIATREYQFA